MKKLFACMLALLNTAFAGIAVAAQDQALVQQTRKNQVAQDAQQMHAAPQQLASAAANLKLPLDHGPRAEVTPWVNRQRRIRAEEEIKAARVDREHRYQGDVDK